MNSFEYANPTTTKEAAGMLAGQWGEVEVNQHGEGGDNKHRQDCLQERSGEEQRVHCRDGGIDNVGFKSADAAHEGGPLGDVIRFPAGLDVAQQ